LTHEKASSHTSSNSYRGGMRRHRKVLAAFSRSRERPIAKLLLANGNLRP
jgi:hypothetical protein